MRDLALELPRDKMIVITGLSGSGKSTLAFDVIFAEGQRRYLESLSTYVRQFMKILPRPDVDLVSGIPPTVAIEQRLSRGGRKSTVATVTEVYHYLRLLYAKLGVQHCVRCDRPIEPLPRSAIVARVQVSVGKAGAVLLAPVVRGRKDCARFDHRRSRFVRYFGLLLWRNQPRSVDADRHTRFFCVACYGGGFQWNKSGRRPWSAR